MCFQNGWPGEDSHFAFFVATRLGVPAIVLLTHAILDQSFGITRLSQGYAMGKRTSKG
jgi:hypothetical protein